MKLLSDSHCRDELVRRLAKLGPDTPRRWGKMTAAQMICHLNDAFLGVMGDKPLEIPRGFSLWPMMKLYVLYVPIQWPHGVPTRPEIDQHVGGTPPADFAADMRALLTSMERFSTHPPSFQFRPHPMFGVMSVRDWMRWGYRHTDHHLRQFGV